MTGLIMVIMAFLFGMALGGLVVGIDRQSERGEDEKADGLHKGE